MNDRRRIEAALRAHPPDEPQYRPGITDRLDRSDAGSGNSNQPPTPLVVASTPSGPRRRRIQLAAIVTAAAAILAIGLIVIGRGRSTDPVATDPTLPAVTTPSTISTTGATSALDGRWVGPPRTSAASGSVAPAFLVFDHGVVALEHDVGGIVTDFTSAANIVTDGALQVTLSQRIGGCAPGDIGDYSWKRSAGGSSLTITAVDEKCSARTAAFSGTWTRIDCPSNGADCLGPLEPGRHSSVVFDPFDTTAYGEVAYTVPEGWSSPLDERARLVLQPPGAGALTRHGVYLYADVAAAGTCTQVPSDAVGANAIATLLAATMNAGGGSTTITPTTVGGFDARIVDITAGTSTCGHSDAILIARPDSTVGWSVAVEPAKRMRVVLVDLPDGRTTAIVVASDSDGEYSSLFAAASTIIESLTFSPTP